MNVKKLIISSVVVVGVIFATGCAGKFHKGCLENFVFERFDKNDDSKLSKKEHLEMTFSRFERIDDNENSVVTKKELKDSMFSNMRSDFAQFYLNRNDLNKDGQVTKFELTKQTKKEFVNLDINSDGVLSRTEFKK